MSWSGIDKRKVARRRLSLTCSVWLTAAPQLAAAQFKSWVMAKLPDTDTMSERHPTLRLTSEVYRRFRRNVCRKSTEQVHAAS